MAVLSEYIRKFPSSTFDKLKEVFPDELQGSMGVFQKLDDARKSYVERNQKRYFIKLDEVLTTGDGIQIAVSTQWSKDNITGFCESAKKLGFSIEKVS